MCFVALLIGFGVAPIWPSFFVFCVSEALLGVPLRHKCPSRLGKFEVCVRIGLPRSPVDSKRFARAPKRITKLLQGSVPGLQMYDLKSVVGMFRLALVWASLDLFSVGDTL